MAKEVSRLRRWSWWIIQVLSKLLINGVFVFLIQWFVCVSSIHIFIRFHGPEWTHFIPSNHGICRNWKENDGNCNKNKHQGRINVADISPVDLDKLHIIGVEP